MWNIEGIKWYSTFFVSNVVSSGHLTIFLNCSRQNYRYASIVYLEIARIMKQVIICHIAPPNWT